MISVPSSDEEGVGGGVEVPNQHPSGSPAGLNAGLATSPHLRGGQDKLQKLLFFLSLKLAQYSYEKISRHALYSSY